MRLRKPHTFLTADGDANERKDSGRMEETSLGRCRQTTAADGSSYSTHVLQKRQGCFEMGVTRAADIGLPGDGRTDGFKRQMLGRRVVLFLP